MPNTEVGRSERTRSPRANTTHGLGPPVLLEGEDQAHYTELLQKVTAAVEPGDIIEEFWVRDVVDLLWEALRLRRLKAALLASSLAGGLKRVLLPAVGYTVAHEWSRRWYAEEARARKKVDNWLNELGLTTDAILAQTLSNKLDDIERIDRMIASAEGRRHVVREIDGAAARSPRGSALRLKPSKRPNLRRSRRLIGHRLRRHDRRPGQSHPRGRRRAGARGHAPLPVSSARHAMPSSMGFPFLQRRRSLPLR